MVQGMAKEHIQRVSLIFIIAYFCLTEGTNEVEIISMFKGRSLNRSLASCSLRVSEVPHPKLNSRLNAGVTLGQGAEHITFEIHRTGKAEREETVVFVSQVGNHKETFTVC